MARKVKEIAEPLTYEVISPTGLNVREKPEKAAKISRVLECGEIVEQAGEAPAGWVALDRGYVRREFLTDKN